jgi:hypothetical protein
LFEPYQSLRPEIECEVPRVGEHALAQAYAVLQEQLKRLTAAIGVQPTAAAQLVIGHNFRPLNDVVDNASSDLLMCRVTAEEVNTLRCQELDLAAQAVLQRSRPHDQSDSAYALLTGGGATWGLLQISGAFDTHNVLVQQFTSYLGRHLSWIEICVDAQFLRDSALAFLTLSTFPWSWQ